MLKNRKKQIIAFFFILLTLFIFQIMIVQTYKLSDNSFIESEFKYNVKKIKEVENLLDDKEVAAIDLDFKSYTGVFNYESNITLNNYKSCYINIKDLKSDSDIVEIIIIKKGIINNYDRIIYKKTILKQQNEIILSILNNGLYNIKILNPVDKKSINIEGHLSVYKYYK